MISSGEIICLDCNRLFKKTKAGVKVSAESMAGQQRADLYECPNCGIKLITGFSHEAGPFDSDRSKLDYYFKKLR